MTCVVAFQSGLLRDSAVRLPEQDPFDLEVPVTGGGTVVPQQRWSTPCSSLQKGPGGAILPGAMVRLCGLQATEEDDSD